MDSTSKCKENVANQTGPMRQKRFETKVCSKKKKYFQPAERKQKGA